MSGHATAEPLRLHTRQPEARDIVYRRDVRSRAAYLAASQWGNRRVHFPIPGLSVGPCRVSRYHARCDSEGETIETLAPAMENQPDRGRQSRLARFGGGVGGRRATAPWMLKQVQHDGVQNDPIRLHNQSRGNRAMDAGSKSCLHKQVQNDGVSG